jgi:glycosyltransferase involved in cell wall biosynthesis
VLILLATYNGALYLASQLDSILSQTHEDWCLLVRDDGSTDSTPVILSAYRERYPEKITIIPPVGHRLGAAANFATLLDVAAGDYFMFCDQDDVWLPEKIERTLALMMALEAQHGAGCPLLVHTDLTVTDDELVPVAASLWGFQRADPDGGVVLNRLLMQNVVTGCSVMINRPLRDLAIPLPAGAIMHDWWLALVAAAFGAIGNVPAQTAFYRQHGANNVGAVGLNLRDVIRRFRHWDGVNMVIRQLYRQAGVFLDRYSNRLDAEQREMLTAFATMGSAGAFERRRRILKYRFFYSGFLRNFGRMVLG